MTLKANLKRGEMYWVAKVDAKNADDAMAVAEAAFFTELDDSREWSFEEADVEAA